MEDVITLNLRNLNINFDRFISQAYHTRSWERLRSLVEVTSLCHDNWLLLVIGFIYISLLVSFTLFKLLFRLSYLKLAECGASSLLLIKAIFSWRVQPKLLIYILYIIYNIYTYVFIYTYIYNISNILKQRNSLKIKLFIHFSHPLMAVMLWKAHCKVEIFSWYAVIPWVPNTLYRHTAKLHTQAMCTLILL